MKYLQVPGTFYGGTFYGQSLDLLRIPPGSFYGYLLIHLPYGCQLLHSFDRYLSIHVRRFLIIYLVVFAGIC